MSHVTKTNLSKSKHDKKKNFANFPHTSTVTKTAIIPRYLRVSLSHKYLLSTPPVYQTKGTKIWDWLPHLRETISPWFSGNYYKTRYISAILKYTFQHRTFFANPQTKINFPLILYSTSFLVSVVEIFAVYHVRIIRFPM